MARVTVEDCLEYVDNKFELVSIGAKRARQLARGAHTDLAWDNDKPSVVALREIAEHRVSREILDEPDLPLVAAGFEALGMAEPGEGDEKPAEGQAADASE